MKKKEALDTYWCALFHQSEWEGYIIGVDPHVSIDVCSKCGASHVKHRGFTTEADINRKIDETLKTEL